MVRYEDLATHPEETAAKLLAYLGLPQHNVVDFGHFKGLGGGDMKLRKEHRVHRKSVFRFRRVLSMKQQQVFTDMIGREMEQLGYDPEPRTGSLPPFLAETKDSELDNSSGK